MQIGAVWWIVGMILAIWIFCVFVLSISEEKVDE